MPLKLNVGLSKKIGLPNYGSLGASCQVEVDLDTPLGRDKEHLQRYIQAAFATCRQAVQEELLRQQAVRNGHTSGRTMPSAGPPPARQHRSPGRRATASQIRALHAIAQRRRINLIQELRHRFGLDQPDELSITDASQLIEQLTGSEVRH